MLKVQETLKSFIRGPITKRMLSLQFDHYSPDEDYKFIKAYNKVRDFLKGKFKSVEPTINLVDPQKRLEDNMIELSRSTNSDLKSIRENLTNQISEVEHKLSNSQQRIEDCLIEMTCRTATDFEITKEDSSNSIGIVEDKLEKLTNGMFQNFFALNTILKYYFTSIRQSFKNLISNLETKAMVHFKKVEKKLDELIFQLNQAIYLQPLSLARSASSDANYVRLQHNLIHQPLQLHLLSSSSSHQMVGD